jgi:hypothetical protein
MAYIWRTTGPWGISVGRDLAPAEVDGNFWQAVQDIQSKAAQGVGISNFVVHGDQMTVVLTDHTLLGPYTLPTVQLSFQGEWQPNTGYLVNNIITHNGSTYMVLFNHTSAATFDPGANTSGQDWYGLLLQNPACMLPTGGAVGTFLRKTTTADFADAWQTAALSDLSDVNITGATDGQILTLLHGVWTAATGATALSHLSDVSLSSLTTGQVLQWNGTVWVNVTPVTALANLSDVAVSLPTSGQPLVYNGTNWANVNVADLPMVNVGISSGSVTVDLRSFEFCRLQINGNTTISFTWPPAGANHFVRRVIEITNTGSYTLTWPTIKWPGAAIPTLTPNGIDVFILYTYDGGTTVFGNVVGQGYA